MAMARSPRSCGVGRCASRAIGTGYRTVRGPRKPCLPPASAPALVPRAFSGSRMKSKAVQVVVAIAGLAAVVFGISQIFAGVEEMKGGKALTKGEAKEIADQAAAN